MRRNYTIMRKPTFNADALRTFLGDHKIGTLPELKDALGTVATMTVFRKLREIGYTTSYSHRGKYYTLGDIPQYDDQGLWSWREVWFSKYGNLQETVRAFVEQSEAGWTAQELESVLHVETKQSLLLVFRTGQLGREEVSGTYVYFAPEKDKQRSQRLRRRDWTEISALGIVSEGFVSVEEMKAALVLFFSLLNEKQRRLYAGLESMRQGHGGDRAIGELLGLDVHTVARGRRELFGGRVEGDQVRRKGGGRKAMEKKGPRS
jgi:hypothetical protein